MTADDVARFLQQHPGFFEQRPGLLADMLLPDPRQDRAVSLIERQNAVLRERVKALEARLAELIQIGRGNDVLARGLVDWTKSLLAEPDRERLAQRCVAELQRIFRIPHAAIRTWSEPPEAADREAAAFAAALRGPVCGTGIDLVATGVPTQGWSDVRSAALIPLAQSEAAAPFGLIALGSADPERFGAGLGTAVLGQIGELAGAALGPRPPA